MNKDSKTISAKSVALIFLAVCAISAAVLLAMFIPGTNQLEDPTSVTTGTYGESTAVTTEPIATTTDNTTVATEPELSGPEPGSINYVEYLALSAEEQQTYYYRFESPDAFFLWLDAVKKEYEADNTISTIPDDEDTVPTQGDNFIEDEDVEDWE